MHVPTVATGPDGTGGGCDEQLGEGKSHARDLPSDDDAPGLFLRFYGGGGGGRKEGRGGPSPRAHTLPRGARAAASINLLSISSALGAAYR